MIIKKLIFGSVFLCLASCLRVPEYPIEPEIDKALLSKKIVMETIPTMIDNEWVQTEDSLVVSFEFTDGDGDLGLPEGNLEDNLFYIDSFDLCKVDDTTQFPINVNVFIKDMRTDCIRTYSMPYLTPTGSVKTISGNINILLNTFICRKNIIREYDTIHYELQIVDRAGRLSNIIETEPLIIDCQ